MSHFGGVCGVVTWGGVAALKMSGSCKLNTLRAQLDNVVLQGYGMEPADHRKWHGTLNGVVEGQ